MWIQSIGESQGIMRVLDNEKVRRYLKKSSPQLLLLYDNISRQYLQNEGQISTDQQFRDKLKTFISVMFESHKENSKSVCQHQTNKGYRCYNCALASNTLICQKCFEFEKHIGHYFIRFNTSNGCCYCGDEFKIKKEAFCSKHQNKIDQQNLLKQPIWETRFKMIINGLSLGVVIIQQGSGWKDTLKEAFLLQFMKSIESLLSKSQQYQKIVSDILLTKIPFIFSQTQSILIKILLQIAESKDLGTALGNILAWLSPDSDVHRVMIPFLFQEFSLKESSKVITYKTYLGKALRYRSSMESLTNKQQIKYFVLNEVFSVKMEGVSQLYFQMYENCWELFPDLFYEAVKLLINNVETFLWGNILRRKQGIMTIFENKFLQFLQAIHKIIQTKGTEQQRQKLHETIIRQEMSLVQKKKGYTATSRIFFLSLLSLQNFQMKILKIKSQKMLQLLYPDKKVEENLRTASKKMILSLSPIDDVENKQNIQILRSFYLVDMLYAKVNQAVVQKKDRFFSIFLDRNDKDFGIQLGVAISVNEKKMKNFIKMVRNFVFFIEAEVPFIIIGAKFQTNPQKQKIFTLYSDLAALYRDKDKKEFHKIASVWIDNPPILKQFIMNEYDNAKNVDLNEKSLYHHLSPNSFLCNQESISIKRMRFKSKLKFNDNKEKSVFQKIKQEDCEKIINIYKKYFSTFQDSNFQFIRSTINDWLELLITLYLETKFENLKAVIEEILENRGFRTVLGGNTKDLSTFYEEEVKKCSQEGKQLMAEEDMKKEEIKKRKDKKLNQLKQRQKRIIDQQKLMTGESQEPKIQQNSCIICYQGQTVEPLFYLCHVKYSNFLLKKILSINNSIILIKTCGHLIHQSCLNKHLEGRNNFRTFYSCFLCKGVSNLRIPFDYSMLDPSKFFQEVQAIISIRESLISEYTTGAVKSKKKELTKEDFPDELYSSIVYQIYLYALSHSQLFVYYMLPIMPALISYLNHFNFESTLNYRLKNKPQLNKIIDKIEGNIKAFIKNEPQAFKVADLSDEVDQTKVYKIEELNQDQRILEINKLFMKMFGDKPPEMRKIKSTNLFDINKPPEDLLDLKTLGQTCPYCKKITHQIRICLLCGKVACLKCGGFWMKHMNIDHQGAIASIQVSEARCRYQAFENIQRMNGLYRNYLGELYEENEEKGKGKLLREQYVLDTVEYERIVQDIVLEKIEGKVQLGRVEIQDLRVNLGNGALGNIGGVDIRNLGGLGGLGGLIGLGGLGGLDLRNLLGSGGIGNPNGQQNPQ